MVGDVAEIFYSAMNPTCASNVVSLVCHTVFRECVAVNDKLRGGETRWLPSLLCRSECDKHWETWNKCVADLNADPEEQTLFNTQMQSLVRHIVQHSKKTVFEMLLIFRLLYVVWSLTWVSSMWRFAPLQVETVSLGHTILTDIGI